jgi:signal transduction histidine kinase
MRRRFVRRMLLMVGLFLVVVFVASALAGAFFSGAFREGHPGRPAWPGAIFGLLFLVGAFLLVGRAFRRTAQPVGEVMDAADRVAEGDFTARVGERGPPPLRRLARSFNAMAGRLEAGEETRRNLLADVAHELRTPLSVIQGNVEGMLDGVYPLDRAHLEPVLEGSRVMSRLLEDLHTLSTAEAGALALHRQLVEPGELVADAEAAFGSQANSAGVSLTTRIAAGLPDVDADPIRIGEVLANLLVNAIRHTPDGGSVEISAGRAGDQGVAFEVRDTGQGIDPHILPHVFDRFVKGDQAGGLGLGLAIARSLVVAHGGDINAESRPGQGTVMRFVLPTST